MPDMNVGPSNHDFNADNGLSREEWRDKWLSSGSSNMDQLRNFISQYGGQVLADNGTVQTPYGDILDIGTAFRSGNGHPGWTQVSGNQGPANGSQFNPGPTPAMQQQMMNPGAMPYNPHSGNTGIAGGFDVSKLRSSFLPYRADTQLSSTGQTDGTLLGTKFSFGGSQMNPPQNNPQNSVSNNWTVGSGSDSKETGVFGAPSFFKPKPTPTDSKPLPQNNMGAS